MGKVGKKVLGIVLIMVGIFAFFTPFTPGSWLVFVGLGLLEWRLGPIQRFIDKLRSRK